MLAVCPAPGCGQQVDRVRDVYADHLKPLYRGGPPGERCPWSGALMPTEEAIDRAKRLLESEEESDLAKAIARSWIAMALERP